MKRIFILINLIIGASFSLQGQSWVWLNPYPTGMQINQVYFLNATDGFVIGENGTLLRTNNGGDTWLQADVPSTAYFTKMFFADPSFGWVLARESYYYGVQVFATTDGGMNWSEQSLPAGSGNARDIFFLDNQNGWIVGESGMVYRTTDGGNTWIDKSISGGVNPAFYFVHFNSASEGIALGRSSYYYQFLVAKTTDGGDSWNMQTTGLENSMLGADRLDNTSIVSVGERGLILNTIDEGQTWSFSMGLPSENLSAVDFYDSLLGMGVGEGGNMVKTSDGGATWIQILSGFSIPLYSVQFITQDTIFAGGSGTYYSNWGPGILLSTDGGNIWSNKARFIDQSFNIGGICFSGEERGWVAGNNFIYGTTDSGFTWNLQRFNNNDHIEDIICVDSLTIFAVGDRFGQALILKSTNGGSNWQTQTFSSFSDLYRISFPVADTGYVVGNNGACLKTINQGQSWSALSPGITNHLFDVDFTTTDIGWICGGDNQVRKTTDGGNSWTAYQVSSYPYGYIRVIDFPDVNTGFAAQNYGDLYKSTNGGVDWTQLPGYFYNIRDLEFHDANNGWMITDDGIMVTTNGGSTWQTQSSYSGSNRLAMLPNVEGLWAAGYNTSILKYTGGPIVGIAGEQFNTMPEKFTLSQNYPNPFNPVTNIRFGLPKASKVKLEIFNVLGQRVITLLDEQKPAGYHVVTFDARDLASGMYFYRIQTAKFTDQKKMILIK